MYIIIFIIPSPHPTTNIYVYEYRLPFDLHEMEVILIFKHSVLHFEKFSFLPVMYFRT
jgi:hypothetical protein